FLFSSRRRHTRFSRDWSSDVCSSDLLVDNLGESNNPDWKTIAINNDGRLTSPNGAIGYRWGEKGKWNLEQKDRNGDLDLVLSLKDQNDGFAEVAFPYFGGAPHEYQYFQHTEHNEIQLRKVPVKTVQLASGRSEDHTSELQSR